MKILIAPDKFKGSLSAQKVAAALSKGILEIHPDAEIIERPMADGGDGSLAVLESYFNLQTVSFTVADPLMRPIQSSYKTANNTAYIEMAIASGLALLSPTERNARLTSSYGTGELIKDALQNGATQIYLFIGGSASNDGGIGIAAALGFRFLDKNNKLLKPIGENLIHIDKIDESQVLFDFSKTNIRVICDVKNPFFGQNGAAHIFAPQKGASLKDVFFLDNGLKNLATKIEKQKHIYIKGVAGAGAAGGVGGGAIAFLNAQLISGISMFLELSDLENIITTCDFIITGEGKLDTQTEQGKVISGVSALARKYNKSLVAVCGDADKEIAKKMGIERIFTVLEYSNSINEAMRKTEEKLIQIGRDIF